MKQNRKKIWIAGVIALLCIYLIPLQSTAAPTLQITAPSSAAEGSTFDVTVTAIPGGGGVSPDYSDVTIEFNGQIIPSNQNGITSLQAPQVDADASYPITAHKPGYADAFTSITIRDIIIPTEPQLIVSTVSSVTEGDEFVVTVTANGVAVKDVQVSFANEEYPTNEDGLLTLTAPLIDEDITLFTLTATRDGYLTGVTSILVFNQPETEPIPEDGVASGMVTDANELPLEGAQVCVILGTSDNSETSRCVLTDTNGEYMLSIPVGVYTIYTEKEGYEKSTKTSITIAGGTVSTVDFTLVSAGGTTRPQGTSQLIDTTIQQGISDGTIGALLTVSYEEEAPRIDVQRYSPLFNIQVIELDQPSDIMTFSISADENTAGTFIAIHIGNEVLSPENITVTYDGTTLSTLTIDDFFHPEENTEPGYIIFWTQGEIYLLVYVPHFSEHTITISSLSHIVVETLGGIIAMILYLVIAVIVAVVFIGAGELNKRW